MKELAHPKSLILLKEDFFWDRSDEFAPFGSDEGSDGFLHFYNWKQENPDEEAIKYIKEHVINYNYLNFYKALTHIDAELISEEFRSIITDEIDFELISICFGEIILTGSVDKETKRLTKIAIQRQMSESVTEDQCVGVNTFYIQQRQQFLQKELEILESI